MIWVSAQNYSWKEVNDNNHMSFCCFAWHHYSGRASHITEVVAVVFAILWNSFFAAVCWCRLKSDEFPRSVMNGNSFDQGCNLFLSVPVFLQWNYNHQMIHWEKKNTQFREKHRDQKTEISLGSNGCSDRFGLDCPTKK